jgi:hypothetical protein
LDPELNEAIGITSRQLFYELAMHHHNYLMAQRVKNEDLPGQEPDHLALRAELDLVNSRLARSRILDYRNKYVGHLFDRKTQRPLHPTAILSYWEALLDGQNEEQFRAWWWSIRQEPELRSVAGLMARIADSLHER